MKNSQTVFSSNNVIKIGFSILFILSSFITSAQECNGSTFTSPGAPNTCTYTYTSSGWNTAPPSNISDGESVCILADNATDFGIFKGDLYIAEGVTYSGNISSINSSTTIVVAGIASIAGSPPIAADIYIEETGTYNAIDTNFSPTGTIYNAGFLNASNDVSLGGAATIYNYYNATIEVQGDISISKPLANCGLLEVHGDLSTTGSGGLDNDCSTLIHGDMSINSDYYNDNLIIIEGALHINAGNFYNNDILLVDNLTLSNDNIIGNNDTSILIVRNNSTLSNGASVTGHYYFDMDDGGGIDSVCASCVADIDIMYDVTIPNAVTDIIADCGANIIIDIPTPKATIDFDGVDDYIDSSANLGGNNQATVMAWVKLNPTFSNAGTVISQGDF